MIEVTITLWQAWIGLFLAFVTGASLAWCCRLDEAERAYQNGFLAGYNSGVSEVGQNG